MSLGPNNTNPNNQALEPQIQVARLKAWSLKTFPQEVKDQTQEMGPGKEALKTTPQKVGFHTQWLCPGE